MDIVFWLQRLKFLTPLEVGLRSLALASEGKLAGARKERAELERRYAHDHERLPVPMRWHYCIMAQIFLPLT